MKKEKNRKITFVCYLTASICYYISTIIGIISKENSNWVITLCLGSAFLCLSTTYLNKNNKDK